MSAPETGPFAVVNEGDFDEGEMPSMDIGGIVHVEPHEDADHVGALESFRREAAMLNAAVQRERQAAQAAVLESFARDCDKAGQSLAARMARHCAGVARIADYADTPSLLTPIDAALRSAFKRGAAAERASIVHGFQSGMNLYGLTPAQVIDEIDNLPLPEYRDAE